MPAWAYPANPPSLQPPVDDGTPKHVPGSAAAFTLTELLNVFVAPVWHPDDHPPLPGIVARGREPGAMACGFCHLPTGAGKPENASLAGLPAEYIVQQVKDFVSGARRSAAPDLFPQVLMVTVAESVTEEEVRLAAEYFSSLNLKPDWIKVVETDTVPKMTVSGWQWAPIEGGGTEPIGQRIFEIADNKALTSLRDYRSAFTAYVPVGSVKRGGRCSRRRAEKGGRCSAASATVPTFEASVRYPGLSGGRPPISSASSTTFKLELEMEHLPA